MNRKNFVQITVLSTIFPRFRNDFRGAFLGRLFQVMSQSDNFQFHVITPSDKTGVLREKWHNVNITRFQYWYSREKQEIAYGTKGNSLVNSKRSIVNHVQLLIYIYQFVTYTYKYWLKTDIFHCQWTITALFPVFLNKFLLQKKPILITPRGSDLRLLPGWFNRFILRNCTAISYIHPLEIINRYNKQVGVDVLEYIKRHTQLGAYGVYDPLDEKKFSKISTDLRQELDLNDKKVLLWLGRIDPFKNPFMMLECIKCLIQMRKDFCLLIVGFGKLENELVQKIMDNDLQEYIQFTGSRQDVESFYSIADIFISTGAYDNVWSSTIAEAMMAGCPLVLTDVGLTSKVFTHDNDCILVPDNDHEELTNVLNRLLDDPEKRQDLANHAKSTLKRYRRYDKQILEDYEKIYMDIFNHCKAKGKLTG